MYLSRYSSEHNQKAKCYLFQHLSNKFSNTYSPRKIKRKSQFFSLLPFLVYLCITIFCALSTCVYCQESHLSAGSMLCVVLHSYLSTVKMCHLSAVPCQMCHLSAVPCQMCHLSAVPCQMSHLSAVPCQMSHLSAILFQVVPSFGRKCCVLCHVLKYCQDVPPFGSALSRCPIFRQEACCVLCHVLKYCQNDIVCLMLSFCKCYVDFFHPILLCL